MPTARPAGKYSIKSTKSTKINKSSLSVAHNNPDSAPKQSSKAENEGALEDTTESPSNEDEASSASASSADIEEDIDIDAPRVAQWEPDDFEANSESGGSDMSKEVQPEENIAGPSEVQLVRI